MNAPANDSPSCPLCAADGGRVIWRNALLRVVHANEPGFPGFYRVVAQAHVSEWSDLSAADRDEFMRTVVFVEQSLRKVLQPTKINLAALGNMVPHLHWHVIARFDWDSHFPGAVWAGKLREIDEARIQAVAALLPEVEADMLARWL